MSAWISPASLWALVGVVFLLLELATPTGFVLFFFGVGALLTAVLAWLGVVTGLAMQLVAFAALSTVSLFVLRRMMPRTLQGRELPVPADADTANSFEGTPVTVIEAIGGLVTPGAVELNGTRWRAISEEPIASGAPAVVVGRRDLTLLVRADRG